ncbi:MAG TPA: haloacid dehalogenase-like hydrolase [Clostridiaceae bacterium]|nr:haloacid dehalogenase-like hydrolase [Clostridiaceae bacterium]
MSQTKFQRKTKENKPVVAICYDFDKTLSPDNMQAQGYIQSTGYATEAFWRKSNQLAEENDMDQNLAYMFLMVQSARGKLIVSRQKLMAYGAKVKLFPGVKTWFDRINRYGEERDVVVEHYIISSGLKEMIEGTAIARSGVFEKIYASSFYYDESGVAVWPAQVINYTSKTQFLFRIEKGVLDINDPGVNEYFAPTELRVPFRNIIYIGDSDTDIPCMKLVNTYGGHSIGVYDPKEQGQHKEQDKHKVYQLIEDNRIKYYAPANYVADGELDVLVKMIIDRTEMNERLESLHSKQLNKALEADKLDQRDEREKVKDALIEDLTGSTSFKYTHHVIHALSQYGDWSESQRQRLFQALIDNKQIRWITDDSDIRTFYEGLVSTEKNLSPLAARVRDLLQRQGLKNDSSLQTNGN